MTQTMTAAEYRAEAAAARQRAAESFERCDTDGFLSQWAGQLNAQLADKQADLVDAGQRAEFPALFDLAGELVAAKLIDTRYGTSWALLESDDPDSRFVGFVTAFPARRATLERKGYREGTVGAKAWARLAGANATSVYVQVYRTDGGFSRDAEIVDNGLA